MLLALALCASTAQAGIPAGFGGTLGVINENTPHYDLELLYHDGKVRRPDERLLSWLSRSGARALDPRADRRHAQDRRPRRERRGGNKGVGPRRVFAVA